MIRNIYTLSLILLLSCFVSSAQVNEIEREPVQKPEAWYQSLLFKPYAETMDSLYIYAHSLNRGKGHSREEKNTAYDIIVDFARAHRDKKLELSIEFFRNEIDMNSMLWSAAEGLKLYGALLERAKEIDFKEVQIACLHSMMDLYNATSDYESCFTASKSMEKLLEKIPYADYPEKVFIYVSISGLHYAFRDYRTAITYLQKAVQIPVMQERYYRPHANALNTMGLCYANLNLTDSAEACFRRIMDETQFSSFGYWKVWTVIAGRNLADIFVERGEYSKAIPLYQEAIDYMPSVYDEGFATGAAISLTNVYLHQKDLRKAKAMFDSPRLNHDNISQYRIADWYDLAGRYYASTGELEKALLYKDSVLLCEKEAAEKFNAMRLLRVEQHENALDMQLKDKQLSNERQRSKYILVISLAFFLIIAILIIALRQNRKKQKAYHELVRKNQQWAGVTSLEKQSEDEKDTEPEAIPEILPEVASDKTDSLLMNEIETLMAEGLYRNHDLTLDILAKKTGTNPTYISKAISRCTGKNFRTCINEYRVKEAIRILSDDGKKNHSIDDLAFKSGFNDRKNFHRVFKKMTGLSPADFRKNRLG